MVNNFYNHPSIFSWGVGNELRARISDKFFNGKRNVPALIFGLMNVLGLALFLFIPKGIVWLDSLSMVIFGLAIGALICFLGGCSNVMFLFWNSFFVSQKVNS